jgi:hypothetical protein
MSDPKLSLEQIDYIAHEVWRQRDGPLHVAYMCNAWAHAIVAARKRLPLSHDLIRTWGRLIEPDENRQGYRTHRIRVGASNGTEPWLIQAEMDGLIRSIKNYTPEDAYKRFEEIHPFGDGNGRTGKVIFNFLKGTLGKPEMPPNFFGCSNP